MLNPVTRKLLEQYLTANPGLTSSPWDALSGARNIGPKFRLGEIWDNPSLYEAHPNLAETQVQLQGQAVSKGFGAVRPGYNTGEGTSVPHTMQLGLPTKSRDPIGDFLAALDHEVTHLGQLESPGLQSGGNQQWELKNTEGLRLLLRAFSTGDKGVRARRNIPERERRLIQNLRDTLALDSASDSSPGRLRYLGLEGEQYANAAERRFGRDPEQLQIIHPRTDFLRPEDATLYPLHSSRTPMHILNPDLSSDLPTRMALAGKSPQEIWEQTGFIWNPFAKRWETQMHNPPRKDQRFGPQD
jgi:hypothetical protein